eukprot:TRINITY_DN5528_c0_g1_i2.p1 TRINITY_DN5528_c0_g1~~TRINITY_DN5528_c0_g1_i2.p1  ORF type:complete len:509 (+),score=48.56 TRINITY_DN5528_c0_g1_i2:190-1716(+)
MSMHQPRGRDQMLFETQSYLVKIDARRQQLEYAAPVIRGDIAAFLRETGLVPPEEEKKLFRDGTLEGSLVSFGSLQYGFLHPWSDLDIVLFVDSETLSEEWRKYWHKGILNACVPEIKKKGAARGWTFKEDAIEYKHTVVFTAVMDRPETNDFGAWRIQCRVDFHVHAGSKEKFSQLTLRDAFYPHLLQPFRQEAKERNEGHMTQAIRDGVVLLLGWAVGVRAVRHNYKARRLADGWELKPCHWLRFVAAFFATSNPWAHKWTAMQVVEYFLYWLANFPWATHEISFYGTSFPHRPYIGKRKKNSVKWYSDCPMVMIDEAGWNLTRSMELEMIQAITMFPLRSTVVQQLPGGALSACRLPLPLLLLCAASVQDLRARTRGESPTRGGSTTGFNGAKTQRGESPSFSLRYAPEPETTLRRRYTKWFRTVARSALRRWITSCATQAIPSGRCWRSHCGTCPRRHRVLSSGRRFQRRCLHPPPPLAGLRHRRHQLPSGRSRRSPRGRSLLR